MENIKLPVQKSRNYSLDFLKFICSFFIVCIHFKFFGEVGWVFTVLARFAVPIFFMVSGYYSCFDDSNKTKNKIFKILKVYFIAVLVYFCFNSLVSIINKEFDALKWDISKYIRPSYTLNVLIFNESITEVHLWFLVSLIYSYLIKLFIIKNKIKDSLIYIMSSILLGIHLILGVGLSLFNMETVTSLFGIFVLRNFLFLGFPLFAFGQFIRKHEESILKIANNKYIATLIILSLIDTVVMWKVNAENELYIGSILMAFALFIIALKIKDKKYSCISIELFNTSTNVYIIHMMAGDILSMTAINNMIFFSYLKPVIVFAISVVISIFINRIFSYIKTKIIKNGG